MSGHNPHSHLSQPNSSWNPLQIPSYIPRQPQLAHMSNERPLARSPLTWHTPTPPEALYSYISANHKNLEINPLLPSFVRGPSPFGSVDLTIQSSRNNATPSPKNLASPSSPEFSHNKSMSCNLPQQNNILSSISPNPGVIQTTGSIREKYPSSNGNNCDLSPPGGLYVRDARQINNDYVNKMQSQLDVSVDAKEPVKLVKIGKDTNSSSFQATRIQPVPSSPKRTPSPKHPVDNKNQLPSPSNPINAQENFKNFAQDINKHFTTLTTPTTTVVSTASTITMPTKSNLESLNDTSPLCSAVSSPANNTSNEDSIDSTTSKGRRKRKPNKTIHVSSDIGDNNKPSSELMNSNNSIRSQGRSDIIRENEIKSPINFERLNLKHDERKPPNEKSDPIAPTTMSSTSSNQNRSTEINNTIEKNHKLALPPHVSVENSLSCEKTNPQVTMENGSLQSNGEDLINLSSKNKETVPVNDKNTTKSEISNSVIVDNPNKVENSEASDSAMKADNFTSSTKSSHPLDKGTDIYEYQRLHQQKHPVTSIENFDKNTNSLTIDSPRKQSKRKGDSDDIETIDKIAAMIADTSEVSTKVSNPILEEHLSQSSGANITEQLSERINTEKNFDAQSGKQQKTQRTHSGKDSNNTAGNFNNSKINDLKEMLEEPITRNENLSSQKKVDEVKENSFEEVETKLEEMFAGIEDANPAPTTNESISNEATCDLGLELPLTDNKDLKSQTGNSQKRPHSKIATTEPSPTTLNEVLNDSCAPSSSKKRRSISNRKPKHSQGPKSRKANAKSVTSGSIGNAGSSSLVSAVTAESSQFGNCGSGPTIIDRKDRAKENDINSTELRYRGPFVQLKPDGSINVVNTPIAEDESEKQNKVKKSIHTHHNSSERSKIRGLHVSTLSMKYDADTRDTSWMCVFCKQGPHKMGLGDLFGPYILTTVCEEFNLSQKDPLEDEFVSKRTKSEMYQKQHNILPVVPSAKAQMLCFPSTLPNNQPKKKKKNTELSNVEENQQKHHDTNLPNNNTKEIDIFYGMTKVSETSYEIWLHEDCAIWAPGVHLIGSRIVGLEAAVWSSTRQNCDTCSRNGAIVCCLQRGCTEKAHIPCARERNWSLAETDFKTYCRNHIPMYNLSKLSSIVSMPVTATSTRNGGTSGELSSLLFS